MKILNSILSEHPSIGIAGGATGAVMPFIDALTKFAQCGAAMCGFALAFYTLRLKMKEKKNNNAKGRKN